MSLQAYLARAERFAYARGDLPVFSEKYNNHRLCSTVRDSIWLTIRDIYSEDTADLLEACDRDILP